MPRPRGPIVASGGRPLTLLAVTALVAALAGCDLPLTTSSGTSTSGTPIPIGPTPTPTPTVIYEAPLTTSAIGWSSGPNCFLGAGGYHITDGFLCRSPAGDLTDVDVTVQVEQISGPTVYGYGIAFRRPSLGNHYDFDVDSNSKWVFAKCVGNVCKNVIQFTQNAVIVGGWNTVNTLRVRAMGSHFDFFVNGTKVGQADDATFSSGEVGLTGGDGIEVVFTNFKVVKPA
jgi:hypothetical protein